MRSLLKLKEENLLFFDIETAPLVEELEPDTPLYDSWEYKVNKGGEHTQKEVIETYKEQAGLYPEFAKVVSIVVGKIQDGGIALITLDNEDESKILKEFNKTVNRNSNCSLVGFVNKGFDSPFIFKRMLINGITPVDKLDNSGLKPWELDEVDLAEEWKGTSFNRASLINIATVFGLPSPKDDINGADVGRVYWEGGLKRISKYCRKDVATTINIFRCMVGREPLEVSSGDFEEVPLVKRLFGGGKFGKDEKQELLEILKGLSVAERKEAFVILESMVSTAKGKKTKITKKAIKELKKHIDD